MADRPRRSGHIRRGNTALLERLRPHRLVRPVNIRLWIVLLRNQAIRHAGALGLFGIEYRFHRDPGVALEVLQDRFGKNLVLAHIDHDRARTRRRARGENRDQRQSYEDANQITHKVFPPTVTARLY